MEIDVKALDMLPADEESSLRSCWVTCFVSCNYSCLVTI
ncbi:ALQxL family class IV lanthipeptide [Nonomuraea zeae]|nr:ALQxL family class IV lanthipeptide [Nonomuraea zeae]